MDTRELLRQIIEDVLLDEHFTDDEAGELVDKIFEKLDEHDVLMVDDDSEGFDKKDW